MCLGETLRTASYPVHTSQPLSKVYSATDLNSPSVSLTLYNISPSGCFPHLYQYQLPRCLVTVTISSVILFILGFLSNKCPRLVCSDSALSYHFSIKVRPVPPRMCLPAWILSFNYATHSWFLILNL